jgi:hypothetical protein
MIPAVNPRVPRGGRYGAASCRPLLRNPRAVPPCGSVGVLLLACGARVATPCGRVLRIAAAYRRHAQRALVFRVVLPHPSAGGRAPDRRRPGASPRYLRVRRRPGIASLGRYAAQAPLWDQGITLSTLGSVSCLSSRCTRGSARKAKHHGSHSERYSILWFPG